jgi:hypothetical protein
VFGTKFQPVGLQKFNDFSRLWPTFFNFDQYTPYRRASKYLFCSPQYRCLYPINVNLDVIWRLDTEQAHKIV